MILVVNMLHSHEYFASQRERQETSHDLKLVLNLIFMSGLQYIGMRNVRFIN